MKTPYGGHYRRQDLIESREYGALHRTEQDGIEQGRLPHTFALLEERVQLAGAVCEGTDA